MKKTQDFFRKKGPGWTNLSDMDTLILSVNSARNQIITLGGAIELMSVRKILDGVSIIFSLPKI